MMARQYDLVAFVEKARKQLKLDTRSALERGARKRPKTDFLRAISNLILSLFDELFSVSEQVYLLNTIDKKIGISDTTYFKFLNENLKDEYDRFRKNRLFAQNVCRIRDALLKYPASSKIQFTALFGDNEGVALEDFEQFVQTYYLPMADNMFKLPALNRYEKSERELVYQESDRGLHPMDIVTPAQTIHDILPMLSGFEKDVKKSAEPAVKAQKGVQKKTKEIEDSGKDAENGTVSSGNSSGKFVIYDSHEARDVLRDEAGAFRVGLVEGASLDEPKKLFEIIEDNKKIPQEARNSRFLFANYCASSLSLKEPFIFFEDIRFIHFAEPDTYGLVDGLLFVCDTMHKQNGRGYDFYRYYEGKIYFIENMTFPGAGVTFERTLRNWARENFTGDFEVFRTKYLDIL
ncbi:hypothetical protein [Sulfurimonas sp.]|uniref:hypothetical protein n=1 Tax=Sulfurimonas sp. TaxID=2022749 RepID=UPI00260F9AF0|nr:hypothetical protein [Sulfurimonas sp.]